MAALLLNRTPGLYSVAVLTLLTAVVSPTSAQHSSSSDDVTRYVPDDCRYIISVRLGQFLQSGIWKAIQEDIKSLRDLKKDFQEHTHFSMEQIDRVSLAGAGTEPRKEAFFWIWHVGPSLKAADLIARFKLENHKKIEINGQTLYESLKKDDDSYGVIGEKTILWGPTQKIRAILVRNGKPKLNHDLETALKQADFSKTLAFAGWPEVKDFPEKKDSSLSGFEKFLKQVLGIAGSVQADEDLAVKLDVVFHDAETAEDGRKLADGALVVLWYTFQDDKNVPKEARDLINLLRQIKISSQGTTVRATVTVPANVIKKAVKEAKDDSKR